jgi:hypothetical protein
MADYHPLISRAVEALSDKSPATRRAVYDRARTALQEQLRAVEPPLSESDIARERLSLDQAIDRVEAEHRPPQSQAFGVPTRRPALAAADSDAMPVFPDEAAPRDGGDADAAERERGEPARERPRVEPRSTGPTGPSRFRTVAVGVVLAIVIGAIAVVAWLLRDTPPQVHEQPPVAAAPAPPPDDAKLAERAPGSPPPGGSAARPDVAVAQRAILYEENQADPQSPKAVAGRALWRLDNLNTGQSDPLETVVRASVDVQGAGLSLAIVLRRNMDATLPASHTIELTFVTASGDPSRVVRDIGLLQLKNEEAVRGTPLAGLPVPVKDNVFLIGLSNLQGDTERNIDLLRTRNWIDLPIRFASGQRAILSFEKGVSGEQVVNEAFNQWR